LAKKVIVDAERAKIVIERSQAACQTIHNLRSAVAENENSPAFGRAASGLQGTWMDNIRADANKLPVHIPDI